VSKEEEERECIILGNYLCEQVSIERSSSTLASKLDVRYVFFFEKCLKFSDTNVHVIIE